MIITYNLVYCVCDEAFDADSPRCLEWWSMVAAVSRALRDRRSHSGHVGNIYSQATVNNVLLLMTDSPAFLTRPPNIAHSAWMHDTLKCDIYEFNSLRNRLYRYTTFQKWCGFSVYRLATVLEMRLNHKYWCEPECSWQTNSINKTATSETLDSWASRLWRGTGIELDFKSLDCFTVRPFFSTRPITRIKSF